MNKRTVKVKAKLVKANLIVSQGDGWRVEFDRASRVPQPDHDRLGLSLLGFVLLACAGDATCSPRNDGSRAAAACITH